MKIMKRVWWILSLTFIIIIAWIVWHMMILTPNPGIWTGNSVSWSLPIVTVSTWSAWYYPLSSTTARAEYKKFGQYIDNKFYIGKEQIFPNKFIWYHVWSDFEIFSGESAVDVPVYAIGAWKIIFVWKVSGYGGLILERLGTWDLTALYGHIRLSSVSSSVGDFVAAWNQIAVLGSAFSPEAGWERKHLHLGIYKWADLYFKGYENTLAQLQQRWIDPLIFLQQHTAFDISQKK